MKTCIGRLVCFAAISWGVNVAVGMTLTVTSLADSGPGTLREAMETANATPGDDAVDFAVAGTITLASLLPAITDNITIAGPGTNLLTISGNNAVRAFVFNAGTTSTVSALAVANCLATGYANGAAVENNGSLSILDCVLATNTNLWGWGGAIFNAGSLSITNCRFLNNSAIGQPGADENEWGFRSEVSAAGGAAGLGGAIFSSPGQVFVFNSRFHGNGVAAGNGGIVTGRVPCPRDCSGRGGGIYGGASGGNDSAPGGAGGFGSGGGGGGWFNGNGGPGGFGGGGGASGGTPPMPAPGQGGFAAGSGSAGGGGGAGGGAGLGGTIFLEGGSLLVIESIITGSHAVGGSAGDRAKSGYGVLGSVFNHGGAVFTQNSAFNLATTNTPFETWTNGASLYLVPLGTPKVLVDGVFTTEDVVTRNPVQIALGTSFPGGTIVYSLDGSDPRNHALLYSGSFMVGESGILRVVAYNSQFTSAVEMDPLLITLLPTLTLSTSGGGTISVDPADGPYYSNLVAVITAHPTPGCTFLQWLGDATGTNPLEVVKMARDKHVRAVFGTPIAKTVVGGGLVLSEPDLPIYPFGSKIKFTALPTAGNHFALWGASASGTNNPLAFTLTSTNPNIAAVFSSLNGQGHSLTVVQSGCGEVVIDPDTNRYANGETVVLTAVPDLGQDFTGWSGAAAGTDNPLSVTMTESKVVSATFTKRPTLLAEGNPKMLAEEGLHLFVHGDFGATYRIEGSTNFVHWDALGTVTNTYGTVQFNDPSAGSLPFRLYRAIEQ